MSITMQFLLVCVAACVCLSEGAADGRVARAKQQRPTRGFKNVEMMTARGFGKRDRPSTRTAHGYMGFEPLITTDGKKRISFQYDGPMATASRFGKRSGNDETADEVYGLDNFWEMLEASPEREGQEMNDDKTLESIPMDWFVNEMVNNPDFARSVVRKFVDINQDGMLSSDELLRNVV